MTGQMSVSQLRSTLGWTQADMSRETMLSVRTIRRIEKGLVRPKPSSQWLLSLAARLIPKEERPATLRIMRINRVRMAHYLGAATGWRHWSRTKRGSFRAHRLRYRRILADAAAGRCLIEYCDRSSRAKDEQPVAMLLDRAPDIDLS